MSSPLDPFVTFAAMARTQQEILALDTGAHAAGEEPEKIGCTSDHFGRVDTCSGSFFLCASCMRTLSALMAMAVLLGSGSPVSQECPSCHKALPECWHGIKLDDPSD